MTRPPAAERGTSPVLFVAREPDETLRTFFPIVDVLRDDHGIASSVVFHHVPGPWARREIARRSLATRELVLPSGWLSGRAPSRRFAGRTPGRTIDELSRLSRARAPARSLLAELRPAAVVVIQDTPLLERFMVREANRRGIPTLVVQWAFSYTQSLYDRLRERQFGAGSGAVRPGPLGRIAGPLTRWTYRGLLSALGLSFNLANSYGGGEARMFAVMGEAFAAQYVAQGVRGKRIVATGHPTHDAVYRRAQSLNDSERRAIRVRHDLAGDDSIVLYATQPVLWRRVVTPAQLEENVRAMATAIARLAGSPRLVLKLHPRERPEQYAFCATLDPPVTVLHDAEVLDLIAACDAFISSSSSTVLLAMMFGRPIVTVNFNQVPHFDYFEEIGGTLHARTHEQFGQAVKLALTDPATRTRLASEQRRVLDRYTRFDGRATERIVRLLSDALEDSPAEGVKGGVLTP